MKSLIAIAVLLFSAGLASAATVTVSSSAVTTVVRGNTGRKAVVLFNNTADNIYFSATSASATVAAGLILPSSATLRLDDHSGPVYGLAPAASSGANLRYFEITK